VPRGTNSVIEFDPGGALVVGGSGGLGSVICCRLAEFGSDVFLTYKANARAADATVESVKAHGQVGQCAQLDLADLARVQQLVDDAERAFGRLHTVCYAAGPKFNLLPIAEIDPREFESVMREDAGGFFNLVHAALPALRRSRGALVALTTGGLRRYPPLDLMSVAPKAAVEQIIRAVAKEEGRNGVRANAIGTGWVDVGLAAEAMESPQVKRLRDKLIAATPLRRPGTPREIADVAVFLCSRAAGYISGEFIGVTGGGTV
jgi:NAD(P)-dependent dehydrogenase (short-subunit alcohol dehydrogenase family)